MGRVLLLNQHNQTRIINILGTSLLIVLTGSIILTLVGLPVDVLTVYVGVITTLVGILATALQGKKNNEEPEPMEPEGDCNDGTENNTT